MPFWDQIVDVLRESIFAYSQACHGNLGAGILAVAFLARLALFPITLRLARAAAAHQAALARIQPELDALRARFKTDPRRLAEETQRVFTRERFSPLPVGGLLGTIAQAPVLLALYSAVRQVAARGGRFVWIRDIAQPSLGVAVVVTAITVCGVAASPQSGPQNRTVMMLLPAVVTLLVFWKMAAGVGLYWGVSSAASVVQTLVLRREFRRPRPA